MNKKLEEYIANIKLKYLAGENKSLAGFPSKKQLGIDNKESLKVLVEQAEKLLTNRVDYCIFNKGIGIKDRKNLLELFIADVEQFATEYKLKLSDKFMPILSPSRISEHAFFHLASSSILPETYESIDLLDHEGAFDLYSIPFKLRVAIENKIKSMIGFQSCDITRNGEIKKGTEDFPVTMIIQELIKLKCLELPCSLQCILNIYSWSCSFCHTGKKEYLWMSMKALETLSLIFLSEEQKKNKINISDLWRRRALTEGDFKEKSLNYKGFSTPLYYLKDGWSIDMLQEGLNNSKNKNLKPYKFNLSELGLDEWNGFYCSSSGSWV